MANKTVVTGGKSKNLCAKALQFFAFFPWHVRGNKCVCVLVNFLWSGLWLALFAYVFFSTNILVVYFCYHTFGLLHAQTVSSIINGVKPFVSNAMCLLEALRTQE